MSENPAPADIDEVYPCVGICLPDEDEAYCIGCGRPWGEPVVLESPDSGSRPATKSSAAGSGAA